MNRSVALSLVLASLVFCAHVDGQRAGVLAPGACVAIPSIEVRIERSLRQSSPPDPEYPTERADVVSMSTTQPVDLDGDGAMDALVPEPERADCVETMHLAIYLSRGTCGHRMGVIVGALDVAALATAPRSHGLPELRTTVRETVQDDPRIPAVQRTHAYRYRFDGRSYVQRAHVQHDAVCHHCGQQACRSEIVHPATP